MRRLGLLLFLLGCRPTNAVSNPTATAPVPLRPGLAAAADIADAALPALPAPMTQAEPADRCPLSPTAPTLDVPSGGAVTSSSGLIVRYHGTSHDQFEDGHFQVLAHLQFRRDGKDVERWPSALGPQHSDEILGHCVRLLRASDRGAVVQLVPIVSAAPAIRHLGDGRCEPSPREHSPCKDSDGFCVISWGQAGGWSTALWCRGGRWVIENERNL